MRLRRRRSFAWLWLLAYVWTSAIWANGIVLCFEPDGHVKIETASSACSDCCPLDEGSEGSDGNEAAEREVGRESRETSYPPDERPVPGMGACACLDVALDVGSTTTAKKYQRSELLRAPLFVFEPIRWTPRSQRTITPAAQAWRERADLALISLRSVVLRV